MNILDFQIIEPNRGCDFTVDGHSLLRQLNSSGGGRFEHLGQAHWDLMGTFSKGWADLNKFSLRQLLLLEEPESRSDRYLLYRCCLCGDIGCGAFGCEITRDGDTIVWKSFAFVNGYESPDPRPRVGPFYFDFDAYKQVVERAAAV